MLLNSLAEERRPNKYIQYSFGIKCYLEKSTIERFIPTPFDLKQFIDVKYHKYNSVSDYTIWITQLNLSLFYTQISGIYTYKLSYIIFYGIFLEYDFFDNLEYHSVIQ